SRIRNLLKTANIVKFSLKMHKLQCIKTLHNMFSNSVFQLDVAFKTSTFILTLQGPSKTKPLTLHCHLLQNSGVNMNKDIIIKKARDGAIIVKENNKKHAVT
ncbi:hypothetical protein ACJX0J_011051, partial [Zea mays]